MDMVSFPIGSFPPSSTLLETSKKEKDLSILRLVANISLKDRHVHHLGLHAVDL